ncbi:chemotaxis protein MotB [Candidatus Magnetomoraceae bacterium gMMP-15]
MSQIIKKKDDNEGDGWAISMADMMTLLLCFFVLMVSISSIDKEQYQAVSESLGQAMGVQQASQVEKIKSLNIIMEELQEVFGSDVSGIELEMRQDTVAINMQGALFFKTGKADMIKKAIPIVKRIAYVIEGLPYKITVEGHTDNIPITSGTFPSNWELSSARACAVARHFIDAGFPKNKIHVIGRADTRPLLPNISSDGKPIPRNMAINRRVVILVSP